ncbi:MAG: DUF3352 domain-containing protein [Chloroflexi bacterium]|nr:DUF3352 domain-containing protein [Chloroflexota bacterium]
MHRLVIALVSLIGLTGVAVVAGYLFLFSAGTDRAARLAPADTAVYVNVYLQPSAGQQMNLSALIGRFPGFADDATLDDKVDQIVQNMLSGAGVDYRADVKPWLGDQVAIAARPESPDPAEAEPVVIAEVKDRAAAEDAIVELAGEGATFSVQAYEGVEIQVATDTAYAFVDEMLVIGPGADAISRVIDVSRGADSLAARPDFQSTMDAMPTDHLAAAFFDLAALAGAMEAEQQLDAVSTAGAVLVAEQDGLHLSGSAPFAMDAAEPSGRAGFALGTEPSSLVGWMPADTMAEIVVFGLRQTLEDAEAAAADAPEMAEVTSALDTARAVVAFGLGIDLDADILPLLDREVAIGFRGMDGELPSGLLLLRPENATAAEASLATIAERLSAIGAQATTEQVGDVALTTVALPDVGEVAFTVTDEIVIIGLGSDDVLASIEAHDAGTSLGQSEPYRHAFEVAGTRAGNEAWVNVAEIVELFGGAGLDDDTRDILGQIGAFAITAPSRDDQIEFHAVLTVLETRPE